MFFLRYIKQNGNKNESEAIEMQQQQLHLINAVLRANETVLRVSTLSSCACAMNILSASYSIKYHFAFIRLCFRLIRCYAMTMTAEKISENENWKIFKRRTQMHHHQKRQTRFSMSKHTLSTTSVYIQRAMCCIFVCFFFFSLHYFV